MDAVIEITRIGVLTLQGHAQSELTIHHHFDVDEMVIDERG
jgi:hypothetical protein